MEGENGKTGYCGQSGGRELAGGEDDAEQTRKARKSQELSFDGSGLDELSEDGKGGWR